MNALSEMLVTCVPITISSAEVTLGICEVGDGDHDVPPPVKSPTISPSQSDNPLADVYFTFVEFLTTVHPTGIALTPVVVSEPL